MYSMTSTTGRRGGDKPTAHARASRRDHGELDRLFEGSRHALFERDLPLALKRFTDFRHGLMSHMRWEDAGFVHCATHHVMLVRALDALLELLLDDEIDEVRERAIEDRFDALEALLGEHFTEELCA